MSDSKKKTPAKKQPAKKAPAKKATAKKVPAKKQAAKKAPAKKAPAKKAQPTKAPAKKKKTPVETAFEAIDSIEAHELHHEEMMNALNSHMMKALDAAETIKIDFIDDTRDNIVEWAQEWVTPDSPSTPVAKKGFFKRFIASFIKR
jgi:hypothetical protein